MAEYEISFPDFLDGYESETEAKGYLVGVQVTYGGREIELTIYDSVRLAQTIPDDLDSSGYFAVSNLLVVPRVTREAVAAAIRKLIKDGFF